LVHIDFFENSVLAAWARSGLPYKPNRMRRQIALKLIRAGMHIKTVPSVVTDAMKQLEEKIAGAAVVQQS